MWAGHAGAGANAVRGYCGASNPFAAGAGICTRAAERYCCGHVRRAVPVLLVLVTLLPQGALAAAWHQCGDERVLRSSCCCPGGEAEGKEAAPPQSELRRAPCCDALTRVPRGASARLQSSIASRLPGPFLALPARAALSAPPAGAESPAPALRATAPPAPPDPIYLRHESLLL